MTQLKEQITDGDRSNKEHDSVRLSSWSQRGRWRALIVVALLVALPVTAFLLGRRSLTPTEAVARATAPEPGIVTAVVESRELTGGDVYRGEVAAETLVVTPSVQDRGVVTDIPIDAGTEVSAGTVLATIDDRPLIVLNGTLPLIADLTPGSSGSVVEQLQTALTSLNVYDGDIDGLYDDGVSAGVSLLYHVAGYVPPDPVGEAELAEAEAVLRSAERQVASATRAYRAARSAGAPTGDLLDQLDLARETVDKATASVAEAQTRVGIPLPASEVLFVGAVPITVTRVAVAVGSIVDSSTPIAELTQPDYHVVVRMSAAEAARFAPGTAVSLLGPSDTWQRSGTVRSLEDDTEAGTGFSAGVIKADEPLPRDSLGQSIRVVVGEQSTDPGAIVVPVTALRSRADGTTYVLRMDGAGNPNPVAVDVLLTSDGFAAVTVGASGDLNPGDRVVVDDGTAPES